MADISFTPVRRWPQIRERISWAWVISFTALLIVAVLDAANFLPVVAFATDALLGTMPFIVFAVLAVAYMKATGAETLLAKAFEGREVRMIFLAALLGGLSPFCSCQVIPFIAALLAVGAPLSAVMAFWLSSPLMDPAMYTITAAELGFDFATAKVFVAVGVGLLGGFGVMLFKSSPVFADPLRTQPKVGGCCGVKKPFQGKPVWKFWPEAERRATFRTSAWENFTFLVQWLVLAYIFEAVMVTYETTAWVAQYLGGSGFGTILISAVVGMPAYLNGYAAVGFLGGLVEHGMSPGAAMAFMIAGGVSSIPAAIAVWALVKPRVFAGYIGFAVLGAILAGLGWGAIA